MIAQKMPKIALVALTLGIVTFCLPAMSIAKKSEAKNQSKNSAAEEKSSQGGDEAAVKEQTALLAKALADGDAKALAGLWSEDGTYIDSDGGICKGREALQNRFTKVFSSDGRQLVDLVPESQKMLSSSVATSEGIVRRKNAPEGPTPETRYSITFVKQNGSWLISTASETPLTTQAETDPLKQLSWLIGEWQAEGNGGYVKMKAEWAANKNFITCQYETKKSADAPQMESRQVIGWDPRSGEPISWHFDSSGGFGWGSWVKKDKQWLVEATGVDRDGSTTAATNVLSEGDADNFSFQSVNRSINGISFNDTNLLKVHRVVR